jgi:transcriptional regulator with XRE-family HTH domain
MTIHNIFADNLRQECSRFRTIADVCLGIGINRQQFNKYLAGLSIPNTLTLRRICEFLEISEQDLFLNKTGKSEQINIVNPKNMNSRSLRNGPFGFLVRASDKFDFSHELLEEGNYYCYFPLQNVPGMLLRSLLVVKNEGQHFSFVRLTVFAFASGGTKCFARGRHSGTIFRTRSQIYLLGVNRHSPFQLSLMSIDIGGMKPLDYCTGHTITHTGHGLENMPTCIVRLGGRKDVRTIIKALGVVHESDPTVEPAALYGLRSKSSQSTSVHLP